MPKGAGVWNRSQDILLEFADHTIYGTAKDTNFNKIAF